MMNRTQENLRIFARGAAYSALALALCVSSFRAEAGEPDIEGFETAEIRFEQNATDGDVEVVMKITAGDVGMQELTVVSPDGRKVAEFKAPDTSTMGIRQFVLESPEPTDAPALKAAYPEGVYVVKGRTVEGEVLTGEMELSHELPPTTEKIEYANGKVSWTAVPGVENYVVEIEQEQLGTNVTATLPADATSFSVPQGFLVPGKRYGLGHGTVSEDGNMSFVETSFKAE